MNALSSAVRLGAGAPNLPDLMPVFEQDPLHPIKFADLPASWIVVPLGEAVRDVRTGYSSGEYNTHGKGILHLRPGNIDRDGNLVLENSKYVEGDNEQRVVRGDVIFNNTNSPELVGKTAVIDEEADWAFSNHMTRLRPPPGISPRFLAYQLQMLRDSGYFRERAKQYVNQATVSTRTLAQTVPFIIAPPEEQLRIVGEIEVTLTRIAATEESLRLTLEKLDRFRSVVLRRAAEGRLQAASGVDVIGDVGITVTVAESSLTSGDLTESSVSAKANDSLVNESLPSLPPGWRWVRVDQAGEVALGRQRAPQYHRGPHMREYLRVANVFEDRIDFTDLAKMNFDPKEFERYRLETGDLLLTEGQSPDLVGRPAMFRGEHPDLAFQKTLLRFRAHPGVSAGFALVVFRHYFRSGRFARVARWTTNLAHLTAVRFAAMPFPFPPLAVQERVLEEATRYLSRADEVAVGIQSILDRMSRYRTKVFRTAFRGRLVPQNADDTPAAVLLQQIRSAAAAATALPNPPGPVKPMKARRRERRPLREVLSSHGGSLTPEDLFRESGIPEDLIEEFFEELKRERIAGKIEQTRDTERDVIHLELVGRQ